jgi:hypothetical protein
MRKRERFVTISLAALLVCAATGSFAQDNQLSIDLPNARPRFIRVPPHRSVEMTSATAAAGVDSLVRFNGRYHASGVDPNGKPQTTWYYTMVGNPPQNGGTTTFDAPVVPVSLDLLDGKGNVRYHFDPLPDVLPVLYSPLFQSSLFTSSEVPTQYVDAVQRAEFFHKAPADWHTLLQPSLKTERNMAIPKGKYFFKLKKNGACCQYVLVDVVEFENRLFPTTPKDATSPIGAAENAGDITTKDVSTFLFPNTFLYTGSPQQNCCIVGFHSYDLEPGDLGNGNREKRYVMNYSSWVGPGIFTSFEDVTALSHELAETFNDPFVASDGIHGITPWWLSPNGVCQDNLEVGDVVENLSQAEYPIAMNGRTYHPQNVALLQWFEFQHPSTALSGAYSYPNPDVITKISPPEKVNCKP